MARENEEDVHLSTSVVEFVEIIEWQNLASLAPRLISFFWPCQPGIFNYPREVGRQKEGSYYLIKNYTGHKKKKSSRPLAPNLLSSSCERRLVEVSLVSSLDKPVHR